MRDRRPRNWWWADNAIWDMKLSMIGKLVYLNLCRRADGEGRSFPSMKRIGLDCEMSERSVQNACRKLVSAGLLRVASGKAQRQPNEYEVLGPVDSASGADIALQAVSASGGSGGGSRHMPRQHVLPTQHRVPDDSAARAEEVRSNELDPGKVSKRRSRAVVMADDQFLAELKKNPAYKGIDVDREMGKLDAWLLTPKGAGKQKTRQRAVNWLNGVDRPMEASRVSPTGQPVIRLPDLPNDVAALVVEYKKSEPGTPLIELVEKAQRELRRRKEW